MRQKHKSWGIYRCIENGMIVVPPKNLSSRPNTVRHNTRFDTFRKVAESKSGDMKYVCLESQILSISHMALRKINTDQYRDRIPFTNIALTSNRALDELKLIASMPKNPTEYHSGNVVRAQRTILKHRRWGKEFSEGLA